MQPIQSITIPEPCHQQWQQMTAESNGRYCDHCCKTVVDFSVMSNEEIITHLSANHNVCGRFEKQQLATLQNNTPDKNTWRYFRRAMLVAASVIGFAPIVGAKANAALLSPIDSLHKKQSAKQAATMNVRALKRKVVVNKSLKFNIKVSANGITKVNRYLCLPYDEGVVGKVAYVPPGLNRVKNFQIIRSADTVSHVLGGISVKGMLIKQEEKEVDRELLYELGIR
ncbi:hypothetical protein AAFN85_04525 [Mucilaginibacter sp. CAU 1740]|uniref:hypothetical protein n=1 Tax=Mucilaginibacter sp. CAU 1740 TaxID=3140365 RepID=UPI00325BCBEF